MAYTTSTLNLITQDLMGEGGTSYWIYSTTDSIATVTGAGYFSDALKKGLEKGDLVTVVNPAGPTFLQTQVQSVTAGAATVAASSPLPVSQFTSISAANGTLALGNMEGAQWVTLATSGATAMTTRTAAQIIANIPNFQVGNSYILRVYNTNAGTLTLTGGTGVTITGTATIATNVYRDYNVSMTGAATITMQNLGSGTAS